MEINQISNRIHPLVAGAAVSVILVSMLGVAALTGVLPNSHATATDETFLKTQAEVAALKSVPQQQIASAPTVEREVVHSQPVAPHHYVNQARPIHVAQAAPHDYDSPAPRKNYSPVPVYQQRAPVATNSPVGIGLGALVGGLLGSQVGGGNGRTAAAIAGAVGGGYIGNEIAKRQQ